MRAAAWDPRLRLGPSVWAFVLAGVAGMVGVLALVVIAKSFVHGDADRHRAIVQNSSGLEIRDLSLVLTDPAGAVVLNEVATRVPAGQTLEFRHSAPGTRALLYYTIEGRRFGIDEPPKTIPTGHARLFDVGPDGRVRSASWFAR